MKHANLVEQNNRNTAALPLADLCIKLLEESQNVPPGHTAADWSAKNQLESSLVASFHTFMVPLSGAMGGVSSSLSRQMDTQVSHGAQSIADRVPSRVLSRISADMWSGTLLLRNTHFFVASHSR